MIAVLPLSLLALLVIALLDRADHGGGIRSSNA